MTACLGGAQLLGIGDTAQTLLIQGIIDM